MCGPRATLMQVLSICLIGSCLGSHRYSCQEANMMEMLVTVPASAGVQQASGQTQCLSCKEDVNEYCWDFTV